MVSISDWISTPNKLSYSNSGTKFSCITPQFLFPWNLISHNLTILPGMNHSPLLAPHILPTHQGDGNDFDPPQLPCKITWNFERMHRSDTFLTLYPTFYTRSHHVFKLFPESDWSQFSQPPLLIPFYLIKRGLSSLNGDLIWIFLLCKMWTGTWTSSKGKVRSLCRSVIFVWFKRLMMILMKMVWEIWIIGVRENLGISFCFMLKS